MLSAGHLGSATCTQHCMSAHLLDEANGDLHGDNLALLDVAVDELGELRTSVAGDGEKESRCSCG